jgi:antirestriction protein ArdC
LCHYFGIPVKENSVSYIDGWLTKIEDDPNCLVSAGQQAEKVLKYFGLAE